MWLLLVADALARPKADRHAVLDLGLGAGIIAGDAGGAWAGGFYQRLGLGVTVGRGLSAFSLELGHSYNPVADADVLFAEASPPADVLVGGRDTLCFELSFRGGFDLYGGERPFFRVIPWLRPGLGGGLVATELDLPSFSGSSKLQSRAASPLVSLGIGAELRIGSVFSLLPGFTAALMVAIDEGEQGAKDEYGVEWLLLPALDAGISF